MREVVRHLQFISEDPNSRAPLSSPGRGPMQGYPGGSSWLPCAHRPVHGNPAATTTIHDLVPRTECVATFQKAIP